jgi:hypothetical protein
VRLRYENTIEDLVAFNRYHFEHSPSVRRIKLGLMFALPAVILAAVAAVAIVVDEWMFLAAGVPFAVLAAVLVPGTYRREVDRQVRRLYGEGANKGVVGEHELELVGDELVERTPFGEMRTRLRAVERVVSDAGYTLIYLSAVMAHVIPHDAVSEGDPEAFAEAVGLWLSSGRAEPGAAADGGA